MKLIALTEPHFHEGEAQAICGLLDRGWWRVHIRKPDADAQSVAALLRSIPEQYRQHLSIHDHFHLAEEFGLGGLHLNGRNPAPPAAWRGMVSRSCHTVEQVEQAFQAATPATDYVTLSPIFDSISKPGYRSQFDLNKLAGSDLSKVFALGGVTYAHLPQLDAAGFGGAAMLSQPWKTGSHPLQFITHTISGLEDALKGGCRWVQLRMKDASDQAFAELARQVAPLCRQYGATLIFDDRVHLVTPLGADGVHLGQNDMPITEARQILGPTKIIGATANTAAQALAAYSAGADYLGIGPYRFTTTKKNLAPTLGLKGYREIMAALRRQGMVLPVVAIGGIELDDITALRQCGVDGIAVSGLILNSHNPQFTTKTIIDSCNL